MIITSVVRRINLSPLARAGAFDHHRVQRWAGPGILPFMGFRYDDRRCLAGWSLNLTMMLGRFLWN
jgi:hypothetical protein